MTLMVALFIHRRLYKMDKVAIYCRLSEEDHNKTHDFDDSESIKNQKAMLTQYASEHSWQIYDVYSDDDFTGSDRNRPSFNRLLKDAEAGKFNIVLCKTQSRFTRELEMVEKYIHYLFPLWGIRFVSIVDNADTSVRGNKKSRQINGLINEWYLEDMSDNIKAVLTNRRKNGLFIGAFAPYGYKKDPENKGHLIIDWNVAPIIKDIFQMYIGGAGRASIARTLNERGMLSPGRYKIANGEKYRNTSRVEDAKWHNWTIAAILTNEVYIGNLVQNKSHSVSYKTKKIKPTQKSEWIRVEDTHEPIIDKETFRMAQRIAGTRVKVAVSDTDRTPVNVFAGKIFCGKCGSSMRTSICNHTRYLRCSGKFYDRNYCQGTYVAYNRVVEEVLNQIKAITCQFADPDVINSGIVLPDDLEVGLQNTLHEIAAIENKITEIKNCIKNLYVDKIKGEIMQDMYAELLESFSNDESEQCKALEQLILKRDNIENDIKCKKDKMELIKTYLNCECLTFEMVQVFIDKILVHKDTGKSRDFKLEIYWNF